MYSFIDFLNSNGSDGSDFSNREFRFRYQQTEDGAEKATFLTLDDIKWFSKKLKERIEKDFSDKVRARYKRMVKKYKADLSVQFDSKFLTSGSMSNYRTLHFGYLVEHEMALSVRKELDLLTTGDDIRIVNLTKSEETIIEFIIEQAEIRALRMKNLSELVEIIRKEVVSREELFRIFPNVKKLFDNEYVQKEEKFAFVDDLLEG